MLVVAAVALLLSGGGDDGDDRADTTTDGGAATETTAAGAVEQTTAVVESSTSTTTSTTTTTAAAQVPPDQACGPQVRSTTPWACLEEGTVTFDGRYLVAEFTADWGGEDPSVSDGLHLHLFGSNIPLAEAGDPGAGPWEVWDLPKVDIDTTLPQFAATAQVMATRPEKLCVRVADARSGHALLRPGNGNCMPIEYSN